MATHARATSQPPAASARRRVPAEYAAWWAIKAVQELANFLPERFLKTAARALGDFVYAVIRWRRRVAEDRVARALPHLSQAEHRQLMRDSYAHLALALLWFLRLPRIVQQDGPDGIQRLVEISEETHGYLDQLFADARESRSAIVTTGHIGFWELLPTLLASSILPTHTQWIVYRPLHNLLINRLVKELRSGSNRELVKDKYCFRQLRDALDCFAEPTLVGLVADQRRTNPSKQCNVRFLGQSTAFSTGAARLHIASDAPLWFAALVGNPRVQGVNSLVKPFKLVLRPIATNTLGAEDGDDAIQRLMQTYACALDDIVHMYASQYLWIHDLWTHRAQQVIRD